jgi:hypothetical protein
MIASLVFAGDGATPVVELRFEEEACGCTQSITACTTSQKEMK